MATRTQQPNLTVLEYGRLRDTIETCLDRGKTRFLTANLADTANLSDAQVYEALSHHARKHSYISDAGAGAWRFEIEAED